MSEANQTYETGTRLVINVYQRKLQHFTGNRLVQTYPVAVGKPATPTPTGHYQIRNKQINPGGVLGTRWLGLTIPGGNYGIHGTNNPGSIGQAVSNGCIRMHNKDVEELFPRVNIGTPVDIVSTPQPSPAKPPTLPPETSPIQEPVDDSSNSFNPTQEPIVDQEPADDLANSYDPVQEPVNDYPNSSLDPVHEPATDNDDHTVDPAQEPSNDHTGSSNGSSYTVRPGDTMWKIARKFNVSLHDLINANSLTNPNLIYPGQIIIIP